MKFNRVVVLALILVLGILAGCASPTEAEALPVVGTAPATEATGGEAPVATATDQLRPIAVGHVQVEVGVGSPIPVHVRVSGDWPGLCAQLAEIHQDVADFQFDIDLLATPAEPDCPPDHLGLPFSIAIPINVVELPEGTYTVTVNGVSTSFDVPVTPPSDGEPQEGAEALCPDVPRPALSLFVAGEGYLITDPLSGAECFTTLDGEVPGLFHTSDGGSIYYAVLQNEQFIVKRLGQDGTSTLLPFTAVDRDDALLFHAIAVSPDGSTIAWSAATAGPDYSATPTSNMWVADGATGDVWTPLSELRSDEGKQHALVPVRFSDDNSVLYYTVQPVGLGGVWSSFVGRYHNLYALRLGSEAPPELLFDCGEHNLLLCIGDFYELNGQVSALAYVNGNNVIVLNGTGDTLNTLTLDADYVGYPTFGPGGELVFYSAQLDEASLVPAEGTIYRVAPPTAPAEVLASEPGLLMPLAWLDTTHIVAAHAAGDDIWGTALVGLDGSLEVVHPDASFVAVVGVPSAQTP